VKNTIREGRCTNCSLVCPVAVSVDANGKVSPEYVKDPSSATQGRLCFRGHYVAELADHPARLTAAWERNGKVKEAELGRALGAAARALEKAVQAGSAAVLVDGNFPCESIAQAVSFVREGLGCDRVAVYVPPTDESILRGGSSCGMTGADTGALAKATTVLAVGDVFGTHPVMARPILDAVTRTREGQLLSIDSMVGRTMRYAAKKHVISPGGEAAALAAIARAAGGDLGPSLGDASMADLAGRAGMGAAVAQEIASALRDRGPSVVILSIPTGRSAVAAACAAAAAAVERACNTKTILLCTYGNTAGALAAADSSGALSLGAWLARLKEEPASVVMTIGTDFAGLAPDDVAQAVFGAADTVICAASVPGATTARADIVLPLAAPFEVAGTVVTPSGERIDAPELLPPPGGAMTVVAMLEQLAGRMQGVTWSPPSVDVSAQRLETGEIQGLGAGLRSLGSTEGALSMISRTRHFELPQGSVSRQLAWPKAVEPETCVVISPQDADALGVRPGDIVQLSTPAGVTTLPAKVDDAVPAGTLAATAGLPETRNLFSWNIRSDGLIDVGPAAASIDVVGSTQ